MRLTDRAPSKVYCDQCRGEIVDGKSRRVRGEPVCEYCDPSIAVKCPECAEPRQASQTDIKVSRCRNRHSWEPDALRP